MYSYRVTSHFEVLDRFIYSFSVVLLTTTAMFPVLDGSAPRGRTLAAKCIQNTDICFVYFLRRFDLVSSHRDATNILPLGSMLYLFI